MRDQSGKLLALRGRRREAADCQNVPSSVCCHPGRLSSVLTGKHAQQEGRAISASVSSASVSSASVSSASVSSASASSDCLFCDIAAGLVPAHVVLADEEVVAFLDSRPVFKGHVLVAPRQHVITLPDLPAAAVGPFFLRVQRVSAVMPPALGSQGTFVAANNVVSPSVAHLHFPVLPRNQGDSLRPFFWPRLRYESDAEAADYAARLRTALQCA